MSEGDVTLLQPPLITQRIPPFISFQNEVPPPVFSRGPRGLEKAFQAREGNSSSVAQPRFCTLGFLSGSNPLQQTEWPACACAAVAVLVQVVSC